MNNLEPERLDCRWWAGCNAPLCPLDNGLPKAVWYPAEPVCRKQPRPTWVDKQLKVARRSPDNTLFFTVASLSALTSIRRPRGIDPDKITRRKTTRTTTIAPKSRVAGVGKTANAILRGNLSRQGVMAL